MSGLHARFADIARRAPDRPALIVDGATTRFGELAARADRLATAFAARGVTAGDRVLVIVREDADTAAAALACWARGATAALVGANDGAARLAHAADIARPRLVVASGDLPGAPSDVPALDTREIDDARRARVPPATPDADAAASIVFTSGSGGRPKGVVQSHRNLIDGCRAVARYLGLRDDDVLLCGAPWSFDYGFGQLLTTLLLGRTQIPATGPVAALESIERHRPDVLATVPPQLALIAGSIPTGAAADGVRLVTTTGSRLSPEVRSRAARAFPRAEVVANYGLTETYRTAWLPPGLAGAGPDALGIAIPGVTVAVVRDDGTLAETGERGEIVHRGAHACLGYFGDDAASARLLRPDPVPGAEPGARAVFTGDLGRLDGAGVLHFAGRRDRQLKSLGVRVGPEEVEAALAGDAALAAVAVVGRPHPRLGDEVVAIVQPRDAHAFDPAPSRRRARALLSAHALPRAWHVVDAMPRTPSGKVDYPALERLVAPTDPSYTPSDSRASMPTVPSP